MHLGICQQHRQLARDVLDIVNDEGETLAILAQMACLYQGLGGALLGNMTCNLAADDAQQVEHLAIELETGA